MAAGQEMEISEAQIAVHWREEDYYPAPAKFIGQANAASGRRQAPAPPPRTKIDRLEQERLRRAERRHRHS